MEEKGYSNYTNYFGIRKNHKGNNSYNFNLPEKMLKDFFKYLKENNKL